MPIYRGHTRRIDPEPISVKPKPTKPYDVVCVTRWVRWDPERNRAARGADAETTLQRLEWTFMAESPVEAWEMAMSRAYDYTTGMGPWLTLEELKPVGWRAPTGYR